MDIGVIRGLLTVLILVLFIGLWFWTWSGKRSAEYSAAAKLPLEDDQQPPSTDTDREQR